MLDKVQATERLLDIFENCKGTSSELARGHVEHTLREHAEWVVRNFSERVIQGTQRASREMLELIHE